MNLGVITTWIRAVVTVIHGRCNINRSSVVDGWPKKWTAYDDDSGMPMKMVGPANLMGTYKPWVWAVYKPTMFKSLALPCTPMAMHAT